MGKALIRHFRAMARNNAWANDRLLAACRKLGPGEFEATRTSFFPSIRETLNHNLLVDLYYLDALEEAGRGRAIGRDWRAIGTARGLRTAQARADARLVAFCDRLTPDAARRKVDVDRGDPVPERVDHLLAHLFQHQIHHRGQAHAMLAGTSVRPPQLDEFFLDYDRDPNAVTLGHWPVPD
ncbi:DinB family protein [Amaricoccus sp.]|uniref:DinB family protein n=1 Tax=Amaricoccus sp. TaxID=1872485 RepID=UPI001B72B0B2|nr:DinB family protein [Amaricoccus sp.]MBP7000393.1 damage-inducible protein DinB [Amaricoccus sp.]